MTPLTCPNNATCIDITPRSDGWFDLSDTKDPGSPVLHFDTAELDAFATAWLAGKWGNDPAALLEQVTGPLLARIAELKAERTRFVESATEWAVRLSRGTVLEFGYDEPEARRKAESYRGTLLCCDVLSTDWREADSVGPTVSPGPDAVRTAPPTPCGPTPNALICACGLPLHHDRGAHEPIGEIDT